jgi:hypothetical protein
MTSIILVLIQKIPQNLSKAINSKFVCEHLNSEGRLAITTAVGALLKNAAISLERIKFPICLFLVHLSCCISITKAQSLQQPVISRIEPAGGPQTGGTAVSVHGAHLVPAKTFCRFGESSNLISPSLVTISIAVCISPPSTNPNPTRVKLDVTNDGGLTFSGERASFFYTGTTVRQL